MDLLKIPTDNAKVQPVNALGQKHREYLKNKPFFTLLCNSALLLLLLCSHFKLRKCEYIQDLINMGFVYSLIDLLIIVQVFLLIFCNRQNDYKLLTFLLTSLSLILQEFVNYLFENRHLEAKIFKGQSILRIMCFCAELIGEIQYIISYEDKE